MKNCLIIYFSQGGTTEKVAKSIMNGLLSSGCQVDLCNIKDSELPALEGYDLIGIGSPVYYFRPTFNIIDTVKNLPRLNGTAFFTFILFGTYSFDTDAYINSILTSKGAYQVGSYSCYGEDYFLGYLRRGAFFSPNHPTVKELEQAEAFGSVVMENYMNNNVVKPDAKQKPKAIYRFERFTTNQWLTKNILSKVFKVNHNKCNTCGICMKECPTSNISEDTDGYPIWGNNCIICLYCDLKCPEEAIRSAGSWLIFKPFIIYNVYKALKDPEIDNVPIKFSKGQVKRV